MGDVVSPRAVTYSGTFHQWLTSGARLRRILPTICVHMCSVNSVSFHEAYGSSGRLSTWVVGASLIPHTSRGKYSISFGRL